MKISLKSILLILVVFLIGTNVATVVMLSNHIKEVHQTQNAEIKIPSTQVGQFFKAELNLDETQSNEFRTFRRTYNQSANRTLRQMAAIRTSMASELNSTNPDRENLDQLAIDLGEKHKELKEYTFDYYFNLLSILNDDQQQKMVVIFQAMLTEEGYVNTPSGNHGAKGNHGYGRFREKTQTSDSIAQ